MHEADEILHAEFLGSGGALADEDTADIDAGTFNAVVTRPGADHLPGATGEIEYPTTRAQSQRAS